MRDAALSPETPLPGETEREARARRLRFDDRVDLDTTVSSRQAVALIGRSLKLLSEAKGLFAAKFLFSFGFVGPALMLPWIGKIITDNVLLGRPFGDTEVPYPPFMDPVIGLIDGMAPLEIMLTPALLYGGMLLVFGTRTGGFEEVGLLEGADAATQGENQISAGGSGAAGFWGVAEYMVNVRLTQRLANTLRTRLFARLTRLPMTTLDDQRIGDSIYRVLYDTPVVPEICYHLTLNPFFTLLWGAINLYLIDYTYGDVAPELVWIAWSAFPLGLSSSPSPRPRLYGGPTKTSGRRARRRPTPWKRPWTTSTPCKASVACAATPNASPSAARSRFCASATRWRWASRCWWWCSV